MQALQSLSYILLLLTNLIDGCVPDLLSRNSIRFLTKTRCKYGFVHIEKTVDEILLLDHLIATTPEDCTCEGQLLDDPSSSPIWS
jgi:hypothetical protein